MEKQLSLIKSQSARVGIVGLGYVGLPLTLLFQEKGFKVIGFDIDESKVAKLKSGQSYIGHIPNDSIQMALDTGFKATTEFGEIADVDVIILCIPTPLNNHREPDLSYIFRTMESIIPHLKKNQLISLESTTYPGTTEEELRPLIEKQGFTVGEDLFLVFSSEREDPGRKDFNTANTPKVVGGVTANCLNMGVALYSQIIDKVVPVSSTKVAEMTKLLENIHRAVNIGLVNEMKIVCDEMGIDIHEVIAAAATKPFGFVPYKPGPGLGGHCIPIDPFYLTWKAREFGIHTRFIELAGEINASMPGFVMKKISKAMNERKKTINGAQFLILGLSYKKNVDDMRESPSLVIMDELRKSGATIDYADPHVPAFPPMRSYTFNLNSVVLDPETIKKYDCVVLVTDHDDFDYSMIIENAQLLVDTRGVYQQKFTNLVRA